MRLLLSASLVLPLFLTGSLGQDVGMENARNIQREQFARLQNLLAPPSPTATAKGSTVTFKNPAAKQFLVDGTKIPDGIYIHQPRSVPF